TFIYDFVDFMPKLMRAANMIVCKAGGLIVSEALASGLPLMLIDFLPGQEKGNADFVIENKAGALCLTGKDVLRTLSDWLRVDMKRLHEIAQNAANLVPPDAATKIASLALDTLTHPAKKKGNKDSGPLRELLARFNIPTL
ncbi:MAG: glycosyltransferase, partial [Anaerolineales bacterium]